MKILISSHFFFPQVGGIETVGLLLAEEFVSAGHAVKVVTTTLDNGEGDRALPFEVLRRPCPRELLEAVMWCDIFFQNNVSLQTAWPLLWVRRPWLIAHHSRLPLASEMGWRVGLAGAVKRRVFGYARSVTISRSLAEHIGVPSAIIPNPYCDEVFRPMPEASKEGDLIFVGRLVSEKGADLLIRALGELRRRGLEPGLTVVGSGPEERPLEELARREGVAGQIVFAGTRTGRELARLLNAHRIIVIPSRCEETFGLVALEGIACGCVAIGSAQGGLAEAMGPCGVTFQNGDLDGLVEQIARVLSDDSLCASLRSKAEEHLQRHRRKTIATAYLETMRDMVSSI